MSSGGPQTLSPGLPAGYELLEYTLQSVLGMGGFGITYLATDNHLRLRVAIKEFFPSSLAARDHTSGSVAVITEQAKADYEWGKSRFIQEAQTLARFSHKNIVQVYRYFEANGTGYMVMAYEEGPSLEQVLIDKKVAWDEAAVLGFALPLLEGLDAIHQVGFLHRDIKPSNIVLRSKDNSPVLLDFGSARSATTTHTLTAIVSPGYGPIEQYFDQGAQGAWSDIYSMAAVLYRVVTGRPPVPAPQRASKDSLLPAVFAGRGRFSEPFLKALDQALKVDETKRPQCVADWRRLLINPSPEQDAREVESASKIDASLAVGKSISPVNKATELSDTGPATPGAAVEDDRGSANANLAKTIPTEEATSTSASPPASRTQRVWRTIIRHPVRVLAGFIGVFMATVLLIVPTNDIGAMLRNTPDYVELRFFQFMYSSEIGNHNVKAAYEFWTPESEENVSSLPSLLKDPYEGGRYRNLLALTNTTAILLTTSVIDGKTSGPIAQTWVKLENGNWYRDRLSDYRAFKDRQRREEMLAVNKQAQFSIEDSKTEWKFLEGKTEAKHLTVRPVTTFRIKNQGTTPISTLYVKAEYVDRATNKSLTAVEWSIVDGNDVLPPGEMSQKVISANNEDGAFSSPKVFGANRDAVNSVDVQYFFRLDKLSPWEKKVVNPQGSKKAATKTTH